MSRSRISTSGASPNVVAALEAARALGLQTIALTGGDGGAAGRAAAIHVNVPSDVDGARAGSAPDAAARDLRFGGAIDGRCLTSRQK